MTNFPSCAMLPEERDEINRQRLAKGYPLHAPPHPFRLAGYYMITAANYEHQPIMASPHRKTSFEGYLMDVLSKIQTDVIGWVILSDHYHVLMGVNSLDDISTSLKLLHGRTSRIWNIEDEVTGSRTVWYKFYDRMIRNMNHYYTALNYIHYNPVKHGYVEDVFDWPWTSLHNYFESFGREWLREKWKSYPGNGRGDEFGER